MSSVRGRHEKKLKIPHSRSSTNLVKTKLEPTQHFNLSESFSWKAKAAFFAVGTFALGLCAYWWKTQNNYESNCQGPLLIDLDFSVTTRASQSLTKMLHDAVSVEFPCLFGPPLYSWVAEKMPTLEFLSASDDALPEEGTQGSFYWYEPPKLPKILIWTQLIEEIPQNLVPILRNEMFHAICFHANQGKPYFKDDAPCPFLNKEGQIDPLLKERYKAALSEFYSNVDRLGKIVKKDQIFLTQKEKKELAEANHILQHYKPFGLPISISADVYYKIIKKVKGKSIIPKDSYPFYPPNDLLIMSAKEQNGMMNIFVTNCGKSMAETFTNDSKIRRSITFSYTNQDENNLLTEHGSDINQLDPLVLQYFAPQFCQYMSTYIGLEKQDYCAPSKYLGR